jgi:hypothetical protein
MASKKNIARLKPSNVRRFNKKMSKISSFANNNQAIEIGYNANYSRYVEYGTSKMKPQPYFEPAINNRVSLFRKKLKSTGYKLLKGKNAGTVGQIIKALGLSILENSSQRVPVDTGTLKQSIFIKNA